MMLHLKVGQHVIDRRDGETYAVECWHADTVSLRAKALRREDDHGLELWISIPASAIAPAGRPPICWTNSVGARARYRASEQRLRDGR